MVRFSAFVLLFVCALAIAARVSATRAATEEVSPPQSAAGETEPQPSEAAPAADAPEEVAAEKAAPAAEGAKKYDLKYKFTKGEIVRSEVVHRATVQTTIQGTSQTAETQSTSIKSWKIDDVQDNGNVSFRHMVEKIDMWQRTQGAKEIRYNSEDGGEVPPGYEDVAKAVHVPLTSVTMDARGKILKRQEKVPTQLSLSTQMTLPLPDHPIAVGESWSSPMDIDVVLQDGVTKKIQTRQKFTLEKVVADLATIAVDTQILTPIHDPAIEAQLVQRMSTGSVRFDIVAGRVLGQQMDLDRRVIGFSGPSSSMHYLTRFTEKLLPPDDQTAARPKPAKSTTAAPPKPAAAGPAKPSSRATAPSTPAARPPSTTNKPPATNKPPTPARR